MIAAMQEQTALLRAMLEAMREQRSVVVERVESDRDGVEITTFHHPPKVETVEIADRLSLSPKLEMAMQWLKENPDSGLSDRAIAARLGISHPWVGKARKMLGGTI